MTTNEDVRAALLESIECWEDIAVTGEPGIVSPEGCALCRLFMLPSYERGSEQHSCYGCPVFQHTGAGYCGDTPIDWFTTRNIEEYRGTDTLRAKATEEVELLKLLLSLEPPPEDDGPTVEEQTKIEDKVEQALAAGVEKWTAIARGEKRVTLGPHNCTLCELFFFQADTCKGCPVVAATGKRKCRGTPYTWFENEGSIECREYNNVFAFEGFSSSTNQIRLQAAKEANFLASLMKKPAASASSGWVDMMHPDNESVASTHRLWTIWDKRKNAPRRHRAAAARLYTSRARAVHALQLSSDSQSDNYCVRELATVD